MTWDILPASDITLGIVTKGACKGEGKKSRGEERGERGEREES